MLRVLNHPEGCAEQLLNDGKSCRLSELNLALSGKVSLTKAEPRMLVLYYYYHHTEAPSMCPFTERPWGGELLGFFSSSSFFNASLPTSVWMNYGLCSSLLSPAVTSRTSGRNASHSEHIGQHYLI